MLNNKGFTVVELIMSFAFVSILTASLFAAVVNYKEKEIDVSIETELYSFKSKITLEIQNDIQKKILSNINYCTDIDGNIKNKCLVLNFEDSTSKILEIKEETRTDRIEDSEFTYTINYITYGDIKYTPPDSSNITIRSDYIFQYTSLSDDLENEMTLYRIRIPITHKDIEGDMDISVVAIGSDNIKTGATATYEAFNPGDKVTIQINGTEQLNFYAIEKSSEYNAYLKLILDSPTSYPGLENTAYNSESGGNNYEGSLVQDKINKLYSVWTTPDVIRLITSEEIGYLVYACPRYREINSPDIYLSTASDWVYNSSYWTSSPKLASGDDSGKRIWVVDKDSETLTSAYYNKSYSIRPVIEIHKRYVTAVEKAAGGTTTNNKCTYYSYRILEKETVTRTLNKYSSDTAANQNDCYNTIGSEWCENKTNCRTYFEPNFVVGETSCKCTNGVTYSNTVSSEDSCSSYCALRGYDMISFSGYTSVRDYSCVGSYIAEEWSEWSDWTTEEQTSSTTKEVKTKIDDC